MIDSKITLYMMTYKGLFTLRSVIEYFGIDIIDHVIVGLDKHVVNDYSNEIIECCKLHGVKYCEFKDATTPKTEYSLAISWKWMIQDFPDQLIVFHESLLPKYRGFAPLVSQLMNREPLLGVSALFASSKYDTGDIIDQMSAAVDYPIKIVDAISLISKIYSKLTIEVLTKIVQGQVLSGEPQDESRATYSLWRDEDDYRIDWNKSANEIMNFVDSVGFPFLGASTMFDQHKVRVMSVEEIDDKVIINRDVGKVIFTEKEDPVVVCGKGLLKIREAVYENDHQTIFPLPRFRIRFR